MKSELVSILIPAYNSERSIGAAIRSALGQTWPHIEVIVVDDGSTDKTLEVSRTFENSRLRVLTQPNAGAPTARNRALQLAQGTFVQWLDADDVLHPVKVAAQIEAQRRLSDRRVLLSGPFGTFYHRLSKAHFVPTSLWCDLSPVDYFLTRFRDNVWLQTGVWLVSRELTDAAGPWRETPSPDDDGEYFCRVVARSTGVKFVSGSRTYYRIGNSGTLAHRRSEQALFALFQSKIDSIRTCLELEDSPRTRAAAIRLLQHWYPVFSCGPHALIEAGCAMARSLGGEFRPISVTWKYRAARQLVGERRASRLSMFVLKMKLGAMSVIDRACTVLDRQSTEVGTLSATPVRLQHRTHCSIEAGPVQ